MPFNSSDFDKEVTKITDHLVSELSALRTGRASISLLEGVRVEAYGSLMSLKEVAGLSVEDARTIRISPWDASLLQAIDRGITKSDLGVTAGVSEGVVRVHFPELTGETREKIMKVAKEKHEDARVALRNERNKAMSSLEGMKKSGEISEDELGTQKTKLESKVADANKAFDELIEKKKTEILG
jgi:ribosome recycling factor